MVASKSFDAEPQQDANREASQSTRELRRATALANPLSRPAQAAAPAAATCYLHMRMSTSLCPHSLSNPRPGQVGSTPLLTAPTQPLLSR
ncbi:MAG: hypothetical protein IT422_28540 [Pirellulaceae bacterium]|nr:hypothetical protein [Pirellulaceae bacterium]